MQGAQAPATSSWPVMSLRDATALLTAPGAQFEIETVTIGGTPTRVWKNAPISLPALARHARRNFADATFIVLGAERISYEAWFKACAALASELQCAGVRRGDRIALAMRNLPEWLVAFFAASSVGAIVVPLNAWWTGAELQYGLAQSESSVLICDGERWARIAHALPDLPSLKHVLVTRASGEIAAPARRLEDIIGAPASYSDLPDRDLPVLDIAPEDDATIFYTSGTTGSPKGALGSHRNMVTCTLSGAFSVQRGMLRRGEKIAPAKPKTTLLSIPLFHVTASHSVLMPALMTGAKLVLMHKWDCLEAMDLIARERVTNAGGVPTIAWQLLEHPERSRFDLSSLETMAYGGAPSAPELVRRIQSDLGLTPGNGWGMTETSATVTVHSAEDYLNRPTSCGPALPISELRIADENGEPVPTGAVGELWAFGPQIVKGYWRNPEASAASFDRGWVRTGDLARLDDEGFCYIVDRAKDIIIRGGENIYSSEVENVLYDHPAVMDAALVALPHRTLGEEPAAVVHLTPGSQASEADLQAWVRARLAAFKTPVRIVFCNETLPRNANGKILKKDLKALFDPAGAQ